MFADDGRLLDGASTLLLPSVRKPERRPHALEHRASAITGYRHVHDRGAPEQCYRWNDCVRGDRFDASDLALAAYNAGPPAVEEYGGAPTQGTLTYIANVTAQWRRLHGCR